MSGEDVKRAILLVDHGSRRPDANRMIDLVAADVRERMPGKIVVTAHMEMEPPTIADAIASCAREGAREIIVHPFFLANGMHSQTSIPEMVEEALAAHPGVTARITAPLGPHEMLADIVTARIAELGE